MCSKNRKGRKSRHIERERMSKIFKTYHRITPLSEVEKDYLAQELHNRFKDLFYINGEKRVRQMVEKFSDLVASEEDKKISFDYEITIVMADVLQIIGRKRRLEEEGECPSEHS